MDPILRKNAPSQARSHKKPSAEPIPVNSESVLTGVQMRSNTLPPPPVWAINQALNLESSRVSWLAGDGSDRCYYRIQDQSSQHTFVLMQLSGDDASMLAKDGYEWIKISNLLNEHKISAPKTIAALPEFAALIIEDYGDIMLETFALKAIEQQQRTQVLASYQQAFGILDKFLQIKEPGSSHWRDRSFDESRLVWELNFFKEQFIEGILRWKFSPAEALAFGQDTAALAGYLSVNSQFFVHRDFHSRNIMVRDSKFAVIDFQDARLGPPTYDLVSLCFDAYIPLLLEERLSLLEQGLDAIAKSKSKLSRAELAGEAGPMLVQRQLKALGSFAFLTLKKNRGNYLRNVGPALETLYSDFTTDPRWPFLSSILVQEIKNRWQGFTAE